MVLLTKDEGLSSTGMPGDAVYTVYLFLSSFRLLAPVQMS